jgi:phosphoserine aminotransferase
VARVFNFSSGPAVLPEEVLRRAQDELLDYNAMPLEGARRLANFMHEFRRRHG